MSQTHLMEESHSLGQIEAVEPSGLLHAMPHPSDNDIPHPAISDLKCCCGRTDCAFLKHNNVALEGLEKDVQTAAQLGQALLLRHEAYMADAEEERRKVHATIEQLESDKRVLEVANAKTIEENRSLLDQLEDLNNGVSESDAIIKSLEATLQYTQREVQRLTALAEKTTLLEVQLSNLEQEQASLQRELVTTKEEERSVMQRWKRAERMISDLQDQIERIEQEAREERERHVEVVGRLERRRVVERELESAAGRLKGAAAATSLTKGNDASNVVSHFVKDILQDNANLQLGIVELRDMLLTSNDEVQLLREQLLLHRPIGSDGKDATQPGDLQRELGLDTAQVVSQELHIHHHYHPPAQPVDSPLRDRPQERPQLRRPKKKRNIITPALFNPPRYGASSPTPQPRSIQPALSTTASTILSQTSVTIPPHSPPTPSPHRWSTTSTRTQPSSFASSPQSAHRSSSIFDRAFTDTTLDSSRPTSPESSTADISPLFPPQHHRKKSSSNSWRGFSTPNPFQPPSRSVVAPPQPSTTLYSTAEEVDDGEITDLDIAPSGHANAAQSPTTDRDIVLSIDSEPDPTISSPSTPFDPTATFRARPHLHRSSSHDSLLSISGMDIHLPLPPLRHKPSFAPATPSTALTDLSTTTIAASARPVLVGRSTQRLLSLQLASQGCYSSSPRAVPNETSPRQLGIGERLNGWVLGRWGATPASSSSSTSASCTTPTSSIIPASPLSTSLPPQSQEQPPHPLRRPPGVNQPGPIPELAHLLLLRANANANAATARKTPRAVKMTRELDAEALRESLEGV
ncbi:MAG: hypothetical protein M1824_006075 [Vezdaea acicularis]|nr:MAG: hypothetical protein M1824_006075 [Vezdaea acicularis]